MPTSGKKLVVTADPAGVDYSGGSQGKNNPQNFYRSYDDIAIFTDPKSWNNDRVSHERLSQYAIIARANGGGPDDKNAPGRWVQDTDLVSQAG